MNYHLFIDNFRGFSNAHVPITNVNFLVGQNSTGKTSVLGLLKIFSGPRFLFQQEFGDNQVSFGHFSDIVSAHAEDRSFFRVGLAWEVPGRKKNQKIAIGWLSTFLEDAGLPRLSTYTYCRGSEKVTLRFSGNEIHFKTETYRDPLTVEGIATLLPQWVDNHRNGNGKYEKLSMPRGFPGKIPIMMALSLVGGFRESGSKKEEADKEVELILPSSDVVFLPEVTWIAPIRTKPSRTYDELTLAFSPEGGHTPYLIRRMLRSRSAAARFHAFIEKVGMASGLFQTFRLGISDAARPRRSRLTSCSTARH